MLTVLVFILILSVLVLIHEAGHFFVAKFFKIKVEEFGFGLPPRVWGKKIGETLYSINWLPIGGFVKLYGEDEAGGGRVNLKSQILNLKSPDRAFFTKPWWQRFLVGFAGVFMNFLLAVLITSFIFAVPGIKLPLDGVVIAQVVKGTPADLAGIKKGDMVEYINRTKINTTEQLIAETKKYQGKEIDVKILSNGFEKDIKITPRVNYPKDQGPMGIAIMQAFEVKKYPWYLAILEGTKEVFRLSWFIIIGFATAIYQLVTAGAVPAGVAGPVGIAQLTGQFVQIGFFAVLSFVSLLSLNLAILNILPIPALDGGRLFFILIEAVTRKRVHPRLESYVHTIGMAILLSLIALITLHDITRIVTHQPLFPK